MSQAELDSLVRLRGYKRQKLTRLCNEIGTHLTSMVGHQQNDYIQKLIAIRSELDKFNEDILILYDKLKWNEDNINTKMAECERYDALALDCLTQVTYISPIDSPAMNNNDAYQQDEPSQPRKLDLPKLPLPVFSNSTNESFRKFITGFEAIINKYRLTSYEKYVYLRGQLNKGPKVLVDSLDIEHQLYDTAKELLSQAFDDETSVKYDLIKRLAGLKFALNDEPYSYIGEMRAIISDAKATKLTAEDFLQYFVWTGLNSKFQDCLITITNKNKPSLNEINDNIFNATDRFKKFKGSVKPTESISGSDLYKAMNEPVEVMALDVKAGRFCALCKADRVDNKHDIRFCRKYSSPGSKVAKLKSIKGCIKCGFSNHETKNCQFKFMSKCINCTGEHMTFLCLKGSHDTKTGPSNKNVKTQIHSVEAVIDDESSITEDTVEHEGHNEETSISFTATRANDIMLETFSATLTGGDSKMARARIFKDNGSQRNFITTKLATQLQCPVIQQDVLLNIRGFVANKTVKSNLVKVFIKINDMIYDVPAICVDVINTSFKAHDVNNIASVFREHGYTIADDALHTGDDTVSNIDMVLGSESRHILPCKDVLFGAENPSVFVDTPIGVMLSGSTSCMRNNLTSLPVRNSVTQACTVIVASGICESISETNTNFASIDHSGECVFSCDDSDVTRHAEVYNDTLDDNKFSESESLIATSVLQTMKHGPDGRCIVSLPWNHKLSHLLSKNFNLARQVLKSTYRKLKNDPELLHLYDDVIKEQENSNIIEKIDNIEQHLQKDPNCAFLAHMGIFKSSSETTKCRVVYLSNICEKSKSNNISVSHNMALLPGPSLNNKISTAIIFLRFDKFLLIFDLCKAFLQIGLNIEDSNRLLFLWFKNVRMEDFSVVAYRCLRLPFGLRPSPFLLTMVLYKMLIVDGHSDEKVHKLKAEIYNNIYVDNGGVTANTVDELKWKYETLEQIFNEYKFELQQYVTNDAELQNCVDNETSSTTTKEVKVLGHVWNRETDSLSPSKIKLDDGANTLRKCLSSVNSVYDLFGIYCPVLLRARLFVQSLQNDQTLNWDTELSHSRQKEWQKICKQANNTPIMTIPRFVGPRSGTYSLIIFTDASQSVCGGVVYLMNVDENIISFCGAYSKLLCENLKKKSIPCLELLGIVWGLQYVFDKYEALTSNDVIQPICISSIVLYTDSTCCLHWLESYSYKFDKMNDKSTFVKNKLRQIDDLCSKKGG